MEIQEISGEGADWIDLAQLEQMLSYCESDN
jgi:hypothetical protein